MLAIGVRNLDKFKDHTRHWMDKVETEVADVANGITVELFREVIRTSPQFSGDFAANWQYSINKVNTTFNELNLLDSRREPFGAGDHPAITYAKAMNKGRDTGYKLGDTFFLSNSAAHSEPYAVKIEVGEINFRTWVGNEGGVVAKALQQVMTYTSVSKFQVSKLKRTKL